MRVGRDGSDQMNDLILVPAGLAMLCDGEGAKSAVPLVHLGGER